MFSIKILQIFSLFPCLSWAGRLQILDILNSTKLSSPLRAGLPIINTEFLDGYGCWGHFQIPYGNPKGKGFPKDEFDNELKSLQNNYDCLEMANTCGADDPRDVDYQVTMAIYVPVHTDDIDGVRTECEKLPNQCQADACKVEMGIASRLISLWTSGQQTRDDLLHRSNTPGSPGFNFANECRINRIPVAGDKFCCGIDYPDKFVYKRPLGSQRDCCGDHTFDQTTLQCCRDGLSMSIGSCPP